MTVSSLVSFFFELRGLDFQFATYFGEIKRWGTVDRTGVLKCPRAGALESQVKIQTGEFQRGQIPLVPQFQCCVQAELGGAFKKKNNHSNSCFGHWEAMVSNWLATWIQGVPVHVNFFWLMGCFFWRTRYGLIPIATIAPIPMDYHCHHFVMFLVFTMKLPFSGPIPNFSNIWPIPANLISKPGCFF